MRHDKLHWRGPLHFVDGWMDGWWILCRGSTATNRSVAPALMVVEWNRMQLSAWIMHEWTGNSTSARPHSWTGLPNLQPALYNIVDPTFRGLNGPHILSFPPYANDYIALTYSEMKSQLSLGCTVPMFILMLPLLLFMLQCSIWRQIYCCCCCCHQRSNEDNYYCCCCCCCCCCSCSRLPVTELKTTGHTKLSGMFGSLPPNRIH